MTEPPSHEPLPRLILRAAAVGLLLSVPRAGLVLARFGEFRPDLDTLAGAGALQSLAQGLLLTIPVSLLLVSAGEWFLERGRRLPAVGLAASTTLLGLAFITHRLPASSLLAPGWGTSHGQLAQLVALLVAIVAGWVALPRTRIPGLVVSGVLGLLIAATSVTLRSFRAPDVSSWPRRPNVILISLDTLRPDRLQSYGYQRATSSRIASFFEQGWRFDDVLAPDAFTLTCHVSMLTGLEPSAHAVREDRALAPGVPTLATHMLDAGYKTMAIVDDCPWVSPRYGLGRGFELYRTVAAGAGEKVAQGIELMEMAGPQPFLMFLHCYDAHSDFSRLPYESDPLQRSRFTGLPTGELAGFGPYGSGGASAHMQELNERGELPPPSEREWISDLYDAGIATLDDELSMFFDYLESSGLLENSIVILTADHGEEFYEHGKSLHSQFYREHLQVPLLIRTPDWVGGQSSALAGLIDITPTILDFCGIEYQLQGPHASSGHSLLPLMNGEQAAVPGREYLVADAKDVLVGIRSPDGSLVRFGRHWKLFDRLADRDELEDRSQDPEHEGLKHRLEGFLKQADQLRRERVESRERGDARVEVSPAERARLKSLGYVGGD